MDIPRRAMVVLLSVLISVTVLATVKGLDGKEIYIAITSGVLGYISSSQQDKQD